MLKTMFIYRLKMDLKAKFIAVFLVAGFLIGCFIVFIQSINKIAELRQEIKQLQSQLLNCKNTNQQLMQQLQLQQEQYEASQKQLYELYNKPAKRVYVKQVVKQPVYITNEECQKLVDLINQAQEQMK